VFVLLVEYVQELIHAGRVVEVLIELLPLTLLWEYVGEVGYYLVLVTLLYLVVCAELVDEDIDHVPEPLYYVSSYVLLLPYDVLVISLLHRLWVLRLLLTTTPYLFFYKRFELMYIFRLSTFAFNQI
jgi:hypothetical protein